MKPACWGIALALLASGSGCLNPATTRLPTCAVGAPWAERQSMGHYDPLPDPNLGPETNSRPRAFREPRTQERQAVEGNLMPGPPAAPIAPGFSSGAYRDNNVVR